ncbi:MAG TPA: DUF433 domain-containing protein [Dehalococcoidia bacterium]|nr:DUF433 domain-containing protein [Dehalococcoidia bacterium]
MGTNFAECEDWRDLIVHNPDILGGKATIRGTRLAVDMILDDLAGGHAATELLEALPTLTEAGLRACLAYAAESVRSEHVLSLEAD